MTRDISEVTAAFVIVDDMVYQSTGMGWHEEVAYGSNRPRVIVLASSELGDEISGGRNYY